MSVSGARRSRILVRRVTGVQASWTERERGAGAFTIQLVLDGGAAEHVLRPAAEDVEPLLCFACRRALSSTSRARC
jgi:hypothetical protein